MYIIYILYYVINYIQFWTEEIPSLKKCKYLQLEVKCFMELCHFFLDLMEKTIENQNLYHIQFSHFNFILFQSLH